MPKLAKELGPLAVSKIRQPGLHFVGGVPGLALQITRTGARSWVFRVVIGGRRREMGLGSLTTVPLARAREKARAARDSIRAGIDPIEQQRSAASALRAASVSAPTFKVCAEAYIETHESSWKNEKHAQQWRNTLATYVYPVMGSLLVRDVAKEHVLLVLQPIWQAKTETASRLRGRIELVLSYAMQSGYRPEGLNPARWRGGLDKLLPAPGKVSRPDHHRALPPSEMAQFMGDLRQLGGIGANALEYAILTAARSGEVRGARWNEIDRSSKLWTIPAKRMKAGREHRVPLSQAALHLLSTIPAGKGEDLVFPAPRGGQLSDMTLSAVVRRMKYAAVPHGFRSTFRDWAAEQTNYSNEVCEMALAHAIGNKSEAAYRRGDLLEKRRHLMSDWATFIGGSIRRTRHASKKRGSQGD